VWRLLDNDQESQESTSKVIKVLGVLAFGLGAVTAFAAAPSPWRDQFLPRFSRYINAAVIGNVAAMVVVPSDGTWRGTLSPILCVVLTLWLVMEVREKNYNTVRYEGYMFYFNASPLSWVLHHACYRACMMTLPTFDFSKYILIEPLSLSTMYFLGTASGQPVDQVFGYADTIVTATTAVVAAFVDSDTKGLEFVASPLFDQTVACFQACVLVSTLYHLWHRRRQIRTATVRAKD